MSKKLLLFDVDGTLVKLDGAGLRALDKTFFKIFGIKDAVYKVNFYGKTDPKIYEDIMTIANLPLKLLDEKKKEIYEKYIYHLKYEISIFPHNPVITNVIEYLEKITNNDNYIIGLLTGNIEAGAYIKIGRWDLTKYFSFGAFGSDSKIRSELVNIAVARAKKKFNIQHFDKDNIFIIGDTPLDIQCAKDNNVKAVAVATGKYSIGELKEYQPDILINSLIELDI